METKPVFKSSRAPKRKLKIEKRVVKLEKPKIKAGESPHVKVSLPKEPWEVA